MSPFESLVRRLAARFRRDPPRRRHDGRTVRREYLDPLWRALGWDVAGCAARGSSSREAVRETRPDALDRRKRADYAFHLHGSARLVCEARAPGRPLALADHFAAQRQAFNLGARIAVLSSFEETALFAVGGEPDAVRPFPPVLQWGLDALTAQAAELEHLVGRAAVEAGALERFLEELPRRPRPERGGWIPRRSRGRTVDRCLLAWLERERLAIGRDVLARDAGLGRHPGELDALATRIISRLLFARICEERGLTASPQTLRELRDGASDAGTDLHDRVRRHLAGLRAEPGGVLLARHPCDEVTVSNRVLRAFLGRLTADDSPYLFAALPVGILGSVYERFLGRAIVARDGAPALRRSAAARRAGGVYYTPAVAARHVVESTLGPLVDGRPPRVLDRVRVLDLSCGAGAFLVHAHERLCQAYLAYYRRHPRAARGRIGLGDDGEPRLLPATRQAIAARSLFGVDLDEQALEVTRLSLRLQVLDGAAPRPGGATAVAEPRRARGPGVSANLRRGNAVVGTDCAEVGLPAAIAQDLRARHPFSWRDAFRGKVPAGGFDVVVGNPPYVRPHRIAAAEKAYLRKAFTTFQRKSDLYCCFLERAVECLRPGGRLGYLVSRSWLANDSFEALRRLLLDEVRLSELVECPDGLFADANVRTVIVSGARRDGAETSGIRVGTLSPGGAVTYRGRLRVEDLRANYKHVFDLSQSDPALARIRRTMERAGPLGAEFDVRFGLKTGDDSRFVHARRLHPEDEPLLTGGDVQRWSLRHRGLHVCYDPARMRAHRSTARPGERERFARPKLLVKDTSDDLAAALDAEGHFVKDVLIVTPRTARPAASLEFVAGVLNSAPARWLFRARFDTVHVQKHELAAFPALPGGAPERVREIERLAAELTRLDGADTTVARAAQRELDEAVGALYGLSPADLRRIAPA